MKCKGLLLVQGAAFSGKNIDEPTTAPNFPMAAQKPFREERTSQGKDSEGRMKVVLLGPKLLKKYLSLSGVATLIFDVRFFSATEHCLIGWTTSAEKKTHYFMHIFRYVQTQLCKPGGVNP